MVEAPPYGTRDYVRQFVDAVARVRPGHADLSESEIASRVFYVYTASLPFWRRVRLAWRAVRRG
ncbi:hypothetical protein GCM10022419_033740 [Nonomuraea rosea]|uniref:Uncharacterized protein n=1 Tax=Nonomuraea rosea TaxID=638574 RepID=A0ABP6WHE6_9ACTN